MRNLAELLKTTALAKPRKEALVFNEHRYTWQQVYDLSAQLALQLKEKGIQRGDTVAIYAAHSPAQVVAIFATAMVDTAFTIINTQLKENQIVHQISDANAAAFITTEKVPEALQQVLSDRQIKAINLNPAGTEKDSGSDTPPFADPNDLVTQNIPADVGCIIYTSGSTGKAKGVVVPVRTLIDGARIVSGYLKITENDTILSVLPFGFDYGLNQLLSAAYQGARIVLGRFLFPKDLIEVLESEKVTGLAGVPSMWPRFLEPRYLDPAEMQSLPHLRYITTAGGVHSQELLTGLHGLFPETEIIIMYGLTESFRSTYLPFSELFKRKGSIGKAVPEVEIMVLNEDGQHCKPGEHGELHHRGAFVTYGYLNNPDLTQQKFINIPLAGPGCRPDVAVRSGDIVSTDEDGFIYFHGRANQMIKSSGFRISPGEVEEAAQAFEGIHHVAAYGVPDAELGETVSLAYSSYSGEPVDEPALRRHMIKLLPNYAVPHQIDQYDHLPLTPSGKIDYGLLLSKTQKTEA